MKWYDARTFSRPDTAMRVWCQLERHGWSVIDGEDYHILAGPYPTREADKVSLTLLAHAR